MKARSLRFHLLIWYTSLLVIAFAILWGMMFLALRQFAFQNLRDQLARRARQIAHIAQRAPELRGQTLAEQINRLYVPDTPELQNRFVRVTLGGAMLYRSAQPANQSFDPNAVPPPLESKRIGAWSRQHEGAEMILTYNAFERPDGRVLIEVGSSTSALNDEVLRALAPLLIAAPIFIAVAAMGGYALIGRALRPVVGMTRGAEEITVHETGAALPVPETGDEIEALGRTLNRLLDRIRTAVENNKRFVADASHELRTPLAVLQGELDVMLSRNDLSPAARDALASNLEEVERLSRIVHGLVALSRLDAGEAQGERVEFDLAAISASTAEQLRLLAEDKGVTLAFASSPAPIVGDPARVKQILVNLIDNAINHTPAGKRIDVTVSTAGAHALLEVRDEGIGIPSEALPRIFERFYRADKARSREVGGSGLGLAIVKAICLAHHAETDVQSAEGAGTTFRIRFPLATAGPKIKAG